MTPIVATFKPKSVRDWSYYSCILLQGSADPHVRNEGVWKWLTGPFFPFSVEVPSAKGGKWWYVSTGVLIFFAPFQRPGESGGQEPAMMFNRVHWNFRVLCSQKALQGTGSSRVAPDVAILEAEKLTWLMGPTEGRKQKTEEYRSPPSVYPAMKTEGLCGSSCSGAS
jgi:hypothetical protein